MKRASLVTDWSPLTGLKIQLKTQNFSNRESLHPLLELYFEMLVL